MSNGLEPAQIARLEECVQSATLENPGDAFINVGDEDNVARCGADCQNREAGRALGRPWATCSSATGSTVTSARTLTILIRSRGSESRLPPSSCWRTAAPGAEHRLGRRVRGGRLRQGSKALYSAARAVVNLAPIR
jgi:hypothetical protein